jgi:hypothetical protein
MNNAIEGVFTIEKNETRIRLIKNSDKNSIVFLDYFDFIDRLFQYFPYETVEKIQNYVCEHKKIIIDFNNKKAILVKDKIPNFDKVFMKEFDPKTVEQYYESVDGNTLENNYVKTILGDDKNVESILRQQTNTKYQGQF